MLFSQAVNAHLSLCILRIPGGTDYSPYYETPDGLPILQSYDSKGKVESSLKSPVGIKGAFDNIQHQSIVNRLDNLNCPSTLGIFLKIVCNQEKSSLTHKKARQPRGAKDDTPGSCGPRPFGTRWRMIS
ncbi:hypothetical protein AVEN_190704-1 [Araneus ventricosus]|uniref:Reverse transcriptase domain-containing protein n=1 Tax=Araneus ventricosus TaxID=182803 RepID=A0A4Y2KGQ6_ARAVE|nr:hypothetical protein AVEN_190704-1 [Araneus ventricosus]